MCLCGVLPTVQLNDELASSLVHPYVTCFHILHAPEDRCTGFHGHSTAVGMGIRSLQTDKERPAQMNLGKRGIRRIGRSQDQSIGCGLHVQISPDFGEELQELG